MAGRTALRSLGEIAKAAERVFTAKGYRATGISDVATALGLSHGALYTYVQNKEALLYLAFLAAIRSADLDGLTVPVTVPAEEGVVELARGWAEEHAGFPVMTAAAARRRPRSAHDEFGAVVDELYGFIEDNRTILGLAEQCAGEMPQMFQFYFVRGRRQLLDTLTSYLETRVGAGQLREVPDVAVAARFVIETIAWFAWHRLGDLDSAMLADEPARATVRHLLLAAFVPTGGTS
ncbi:MAG TPA: TetR/AcrR family transcriptional regulator [Pseudonocardiaceae bacterium]